MKIALIITDQGLGALVDAQAGSTNSVRVAAIGLTATPFAMSRTLTGLPGEFKRIEGVAGVAAAENIIHTVAQDSSDEDYEVTGFGLFLDSGDLFAVFSRAEGEGALFTKSAEAAFLFAADIAFEADIAELIEFGDSTFLYPPATATQKGVAYLAEDADFAGAGDAEKIVTPAMALSRFIALSARAAANGVASLDANGKIPPSQLPAQDSIDTFYAASDAEMTALATAGPGDFCQRTDLNKTYRLAAAPASTLANWLEFLSPGAPVRSVNGKIGDVNLTPADVGAAPTTRQVLPGGLIRGGGSLAADRQLIVDAASVAEVMAGTEALKAVTPASLATMLAQLAAAIPGARRVDTSGLATGGGDLTSNRTITVPKASAADVEGMVDDTKAITAAALAGTLRSIGATGYLRIPGTPLILQWGAGVQTASHGSNSFYFPLTFPNACFQVQMTPTGDPDDGDESDENMWASGFSQGGFSVSVGGDSRDVGFTFLAIGI